MNSATKLWLDLNWNMPRQCGTSPSSTVPPKLKLYNEARHVSLAMTTNVTALLQKLQWDSLQQRQARSQVLMLYRIRMDWLPFLTQSVSRQLWSTPEGSKPATDISSATHTCTIKPSFLVQTDYGTPCQLMSASASCRLTV